MIPCPEIVYILISLAHAVWPSWSSPSCKSNTRKAFWATAAHLSWPSWLASFPVVLGMCEVHPFDVGLDCVILNLSRDDITLAPAGLYWVWVVIRPSWSSRFRPRGLGWGRKDGDCLKMVATWGIGNWRYVLEEVHWDLMISLRNFRNKNTQNFKRWVVAS